MKLTFHENVSKNIYNKEDLQVYTAVLHKIYGIKSRYNDMLLNKTFQCLIL